MARRSEKGSIVGYVLVGAVLAAMFVGGVYLVRHGGIQGEVAQTDQATTEDSQNSASDENKDEDKGENSSESLTDTLKKQAEKNDKEKQESQNSQNSQNSSSGDQNAAKNDSSSASSEKAEDNSGAAGVSSSISGNTQIPRTGVGKPAEELPTTGPTEVISAVAGAGLLGLTVAYIRSRRLI